MNVRTRRRWARGFTLVELGVVVLIIGILVSFILVAGMEGTVRAQNKATQALVAKLELAVNDRLESLTNLRADINLTHQFLGSHAVDPKSNSLLYLPSDRRAQVIAQAELIKAEMPDVFFIQVALPIPYSTNRSDFLTYPLNFCGRAYPGNPVNVLPAHEAYVLPLGNSILYDGASSFGAINNPLNPPPNWKPAGYGIYGASYVAAAAIVKNVGNAPVDVIPGTTHPPKPVLPTGYDGVDNNGNGLVDELAEWIDLNPTGPFTPDNEILDSINYTLLQHTHKTARSEMLYALLVEGQGPFGSVFTTSDFSASEIGDTDGDGLPEFVDPYGEPLQFFRWPTHYSSDFQRGAINTAALAFPASGQSLTVYRDRSIPREKNPLDAADLLVSPAWWSYGIGATGKPSSFAVYFDNLFFSTLDPLAGFARGDDPAFFLWDRNGFFRRRAFRFKPLILSSGPDRVLGIPLMEYGPGSRLLTTWRVGETSQPVATLSSLGDVENTAANLIMIENQAAPYDPVRVAYQVQRFPLPNVGNEYSVVVPPAPPSNLPFPSNVFEPGLDDVTNHNIQSSGGTLAQ